MTWQSRVQSLTAWEAWPMPLATNWQNLLGKVDSFAAARTTLGILAIHVWRRTAAITSDAATATSHHCHLAMTLLTAQCVILQQMSCWAFQHFTTQTCLNNTSHGSYLPLSTTTVHVLLLGNNNDDYNYYSGTPVVWSVVNLSLFWLALVNVSALLLPLHSWPFFRTHQNA